MMVGFCLKIVCPPYLKYCQAFFGLSGIFTPTSTFEYGLQFATVLAIPGLHSIPHPVPIHGCHGTERGIAMKRTLMRQRTPWKLDSQLWNCGNASKLEELFVNPKVTWLLKWCFSSRSHRNPQLCYSLWCRIHQVVNQNPEIYIWCSNQKCT